MTYPTRLHLPARAFVLDDKDLHRIRAVQAHFYYAYTSPVTWWKSLRGRDAQRAGRVVAEQIRLWLATLRMATCLSSRSLRDYWPGFTRAEAVAECEENLREYGRMWADIRGRSDA